MPHLGSCFELRTLEFEELPPLQITGDDGAEENAAPRIQDTAIAMVAKDGETVPLKDPFQMRGAVERWLGDLGTMMRETLAGVLDVALDTAANWELDKPRDAWVFDYPAQIVLLSSQIYWTDECAAALDELEEGEEEALKAFYELSTSRLEALIRVVQGDLSKEERTKFVALITLDVHSRDVVHKLLEKKVEGQTDFLWQQQLRFYWHESSRECKIKICDFRSAYSYEYIGNTSRLVITPLTDRCYITLTMALRLMLGGAPAGPAGTGKTETTKDLARALGLPIYVFNCSDQMNYQTMADIFKGLAQTGAWGCFDEFNRIQIEVLSVVATQVKLVLDNVRLFSVVKNREEAYRSAPAGTPPAKVGEFEFFGHRISLIPTTGFFITMNPGYAGRTELPENLKANFRYCAMIRPDLEPICENWLMAQGFVMARSLAVKFVTLYGLSTRLLSQQAHYDWGLRAVKSLLVVTGKLKRAAPEDDEDLILMRALRDFNIPKLVDDDIPIL